MKSRLFEDILHEKFDNSDLTSLCKAVSANLDTYITHGDNESKKKLASDLRGNLNTSYQKNDISLFKDTLVKVDESFELDKDTSNIVKKFLQSQQKDNNKNSQEQQTKDTNGPKTMNKLSIANIIAILGQFGKNANIASLFPQTATNNAYAISYSKNGESLLLYKTEDNTYALCVQKDATIKAAQVLSTGAPNSKNARQTNAMNMAQVPKNFIGVLNDALAIQKKQPLFNSDAEDENIKNFNGILAALAAGKLRESKETEGSFKQADTVTKIAENANVVPYTLNKATLDGIRRDTEQIVKNYARHPYADQVVKAMEDNMTGNKYIKVGNQAYREAFEYYKKAAMSILKTLREADATVSLADLRDVSDSKIKDGVNLVDRIYKTPSNQKWESRDFLDAVQAAREGDQTAIGFLMYKHAPMIINTYWRNFLGPNPKMRKVRIEEDGGLKSSILGWIGICLKALIKGGVDITKKNGNERHKFSTLEGFDESKVTGKPENAFASHFRMDVIEQAKVYNTMNDANGVSNADTPVSMTDLEFDNGRERTDGEDDAFAREGLEDSVLDKLSKDDFLKNWFDYAQDETLNDGKKCTPAAALWKLLTNPDATNLKAVAEEMGVSRGTFETLVKKAISIMPQYDIEYGDLMSACDRYGTAKIASYLAH